MPLDRSGALHHGKGSSEGLGEAVRGAGRTRFHPLGQRSGVRREGGKGLARSLRGAHTYIEPGSPWENAYAETFIGRFGDELLKREVFASLLEAKVLVEDYRNHYNQRRPHSALGYRTPAEFAASCRSASVEMALTKELQSVTTLS